MGFKHVKYWRIIYSTDIYWVSIEYQTVFQRMGTGPLKKSQYNGLTGYKCARKQWSNVIPNDDELRKKYERAIAQNDEGKG